MTKLLNKNFIIFFTRVRDTYSPIEYLSMSGMKARSCACVIFSTGVGMPSMMRGGSSKSEGSSCAGGGACGHPPSPN